MASPKSTSLPVRRLVVGLLILAAVGVFFLRPSRRARVHFERGKLYLREDRPMQAHAEFARAVELAPPSWEARYLMGESLANAGRLREAVAEWRALRGTPFAVAALAGAAERARQADMPDIALEICEEARADQFPLASFLAVEGRIFVAQDDRAAAWDRFREALRLEPTRTDLAVEFAGLLTGVEAYDEAEQVLVAASEHQPRSAALLIQRAELEKRRRRPAEALALYRLAVAADPGIMVARVAFMELLADQGQWVEAEAEARALAENPQAAPLAEFVLGRVTLGRREYSAAVDHFKQAKLSLPNDPKVLAWLGRALLKYGEPEAGLASLQSAVARAPGDDALRLALVRALWDLARYEEARDAAVGLQAPPETTADRMLIARVQAAAAEGLTSLDMPALLERARAALAAGDVAAAQRAATTAHRQSPNDPQPLVMLGLAAISAKDARAALGYLEEARRRAPGNATVAINRARILQTLGQPGLAAGTLEAALQAEGAETKALVPELAALLVARGGAREAEALIRTHMPPPLSEPVAVLLAQSLLGLHRAADAITAVEGLESADALRCRARAHLALRQDAAARDALVALAQADPATAGLIDVLFPVAGEAAAQQRRAAVSTRRDRVAGLSGTRGTLLDVLALAERGDWDGAGALQAQHWPGTSALTQDALPGDAGAYVAAVVLQAMQWPESAARFFADARVGTHPVLVEPVVDSFLRAGDAPEALRLAEAATGDDVPVASLWRRRIALNRQLRSPKATAKVAAVALRLFPSDAGVLTLAGQIARARGDDAAAIQSYRRAVEAGAGAEVQNTLAWLLAQEDETLAEALELATAARDAAPFSAAVADTLGWCYFRQDRVDQALFYTNLAVLLDPFDGELRYHRGRALAASGRAEAAREDCKAIRRWGVAAFADSAEVQAFCRQVAG